jgi:phosphatidylserine decarboxylase
MIAKEGLREIALATVILGALCATSIWLFWPAAIPCIAIWLWILSFFRDPVRQRTFLQGELCAPADGKVTEVTEVGHYGPLGGPAIRVGIFLSLFDVHINRAPCSGQIRSISYKRGEFLDARHPESGRRNESNALLIDPESPLPGPVEVRQIAGILARRIICDARPDEHLLIGARFGLIKFGSRTELIIPLRDDIKVEVKVGDKVRAGLTVMARHIIDDHHRAVREPAIFAAAKGSTG